MTKNKASPPQKPAPQMSAEMAEQQQQLADKLREIFQLERGDLDFGIYRVLACKKEQINDFLDKKLPRVVEKAMADSGQEEINRLQKELEKTKEQAKEIGAKLEDSEKYVALQKRLAEAKRPAKKYHQDCADVFKHLCAFFARYYNNGDFMPRRRYMAEGKEAYLLPYNGEEVKLHWANADQYYIKTAQNFSSYQFLLEGKALVRFEVVKADAEAKAAAKRHFLLAAKTPAIMGEGGELVIRFEHLSRKDTKKKQEGKNGINEEAEKSLLDKHLPALQKRLTKRDVDWRQALAALCPTKANEARTVLGKHLARFTAKNEFDYFIHKNLGGFLRRELEMFIKTDVLQLADLQSAGPEDFERAKAKMRAIEELGEKLIALLEQTEEFQKKLWLKKKFVLQTNYCLTVDRIPEKLRGRVVANKAQVEEWRQLFAIDDLPGGKKPTAAFLAQNPHLVVDTRHFDSAFVDELLATLGDKAPLCDQFNGLLVHGENFAALNLLQAQYGGRVQTVYIDPPYNTAASAILYKNDYKDSSWLALMNDRLQLAKGLMADGGVLCCAIDDEEVGFLRHLMASIFYVELGVGVIRSNPAGRKTKGRLAPAHEYALFYGKTAQSIPGALEKTEEQLKAYPDEDEIGRYVWTNLIRSGTGDLREDRRKMFYPIYVNGKDQFRIPYMEWDDELEQWELQEELMSGEVAVYPIRKKGNQTVEGRWHRGFQRLLDEPEEYCVQRDKKSGNISIEFKKRMDEDALPKTLWEKGAYASANGTMDLSRMLSAKLFDFPKSVELVKDCIKVGVNGDISPYVLDFFAGSGTTGHAIIDLNREDKGDRKYVLVEMGNHFENVLLPRMKKAVYSKKWSNGKPVEEKLKATEKKEKGITGKIGLQGVSQMFRYVRLESYEDSMDNLQVRQSGKTQKLLDEAGNKMAESYLLRYALNAETGDDPALAGGDFSKPDAYKICVTEKGARATAPVDLAETFNFLLGLQVATRRRVDGVLAITGTTAKGESCLVLWRKIDEDEAKAAAKLDKWFAANRDKLGANFAELNKIYVNGAHTLNAMRKSQEGWQAESIEAEFRAQMFQESGR